MCQARDGGEKHITDRSDRNHKRLIEDVRRVRRRHTRDDKWHDRDANRGRPVVGDSDSVQPYIEIDQVPIDLLSAPDSGLIPSAAYKPAMRFTRQAKTPVVSHLGEVRLPCLAEDTV